MSIEVRVPTLGESVTEATVATWFKKPGDSVAVDEMLCELETDKVTVEVPSPTAGTVIEIIATEGSTVGVEALLAQINATDSDETNIDEPIKTTSTTNNDIAVMVPTLGESVSEATVSEWFKTSGDTVNQDEMLCELETDKVSVEVPAPSSGTLKEILAPKAGIVKAGGQLATITGSISQTETNASYSETNDIEDAPSAKKLMTEKNLSRSTVSGSGKGGRIMKEDVQRILSDEPAQTTIVQETKAPADKNNESFREERVKMTRLRQTIANRLKDSQNTAAMLTTFNEVDMSAVMAFRSEFKELFFKKHGVKLGFMSFFTIACCHALKEVPEVNAEIDGTEIIYKNYVNMGIATGTPTGLVVPVIRDAHDMSFNQIEKVISEKGALARDGKLTMADMQGGTFTISNGGVYGSLMSSPILNPPQSGILGMHKIQERPIAVNGEVVIRPMMYLALSYDHRIVDGKGAVTFLVRIKECLEDPRRLLMDL